MKMQRNWARGENNISYKLTEEQVAEIRATPVERRGTKTLLARVHGVSQTMIGYIINGKRHPNRP